MNAKNYVNHSEFIVSVCEIDLSFSKISGISSSAEITTFVEGGGQMHLFYAPKTSAGTITFEKGISIIDKKTAKIFTPGSYIGDISIILMKNGNVAESYYVESGMVESWELDALDAIQSGIALKTFKITHTGLKIE